MLRVITAEGMPLPVLLQAGIQFKNIVARGWQSMPDHPSTWKEEEKQPIRDCVIEVPFDALPAHDAAGTAVSAHRCRCWEQGASCLFPRTRAANRCRCWEQGASHLFPRTKAVNRSPRLALPCLALCTQAAMIPTSLPLLISLSAPISYIAFEDFPVGPEQRWSVRADWCRVTCCSPSALTCRTAGPT
jgi:hypothetical protein